VARIIIKCGGCGRELGCQLDSVSESEVHLKVVGECECWQKQQAEKEAEIKKLKGQLDMVRSAVA
jgi:hypothetical protein